MRQGEGGMGVCVCVVCVYLLCVLCQCCGGVLCCVCNRKRVYGRLVGVVGIVRGEGQGWGSWGELGAEVNSSGLTVLPF